MLLGAVWLVLAAVAVTAGSAALGRAVADVASLRRMPVAPVRSWTVGLAAATATTLVAAGRGQASVAGGVAPGTALFVLAAAFGAALLLGRRPVEVREPMGFVAAAAALVLIALLASDRELARGEGLLLVLVCVPYAAWAAMEPGRDRIRVPEPAVPTREAVPAPPWNGLEPGHEGPKPRGPDRVPPEPGPGPGAWPGPEAWPGIPQQHQEEPAPHGRLEPPGSERAEVGRSARWPLRAAAGVAVLAGGGFALVEGTLRVATRAPLAPGFAGAAIAGSIAGLPFAVLVAFPRRRAVDPDPAGAALGAVTGLATLVPGLAAVVRPYGLDGPATVALLGVAGLFALAGAWMLFRGRGGRVLGALVLVGYAACLAYAGSL